MARRPRRKHRVTRETTTACILDAFRAAMLVGQQWESPFGPAVVVDVYKLTGEPLYGVEYRLISEWGKEAFR